MRYLGWILKLALFVVAFTFAVKNTDTVAVRYYLGVEWQTPLIFVMLVAFCAGVAFGITACLGQLFRLRREISALRGGAPGAESDGAPAEQRKLKNEMQG